VTRPRDRDRRAKGRGRGGGGGGVVVRARARVAAAGKQPWFIGLGASIGLEASRRRSVTASKRRSVQGASNSGWVGVGGVDGRPADDVWAPLISRWTLPPAARPCSHAVYKAASTRYYGALIVRAVWTVWTPFPSSFLFLLLFPFTHSHSLSSCTPFTRLSPSLSCHLRPLVCPPVGIDCPLARLPL
jgi:hypothetical protein